MDRLWGIGWRLAAGLALAAGARAQRPARVAIRGTVDVPGEGLSVPMLRDARAVGLPPPTLRTYRGPDGRLFETRAPRAFWYASQFLGRWEDAGGTRMTLGKATALFPRAWPRPHVAREEYERIVAGSPAPETPAEWRRWIETFADARIEGEPQPLAAPSRIAEARLYRFAGGPPVRLGVAFAFRPDAFAPDAGHGYFALFEFTSDVDLEAFERDLPAVFLAGLSRTARPGAGPAAQERYASLAAPGEAERSGAFVTSRQRAIDSIRGLSGWWYVETPHYIIVSNLPGRRAPVVRQIQRDVEPLRRAFEALVPPRTPVEAVSVVRIFGDAEDYARYVGPELRWSGGAWIAARGELVVRPRSGASPREQRAWILGTVVHEAFHQYLHYALGGRPPGVWFNEGHAAFFEGADIRGENVRIGEVTRHADVLDRLVAEDRLALDRLLRMSYADFYAAGGTARTRAENYARAWGLVYFLQKGAPLGEHRRFAALPERYLEAFARDPDNDRAVAAALDGATPAELEAALRAFWTSAFARRNAVRHDPLAARARAPGR